MLGSGGMPAGGNLPLLSLMYIINDVATWRMLLEHWSVFAWRRTFPSVGSRMLISTAMMPMTTRSSTKVKARDERFLRGSLDVKSTDPLLRRSRSAKPDGCDQSESVK